MNNQLRLINFNVESFAGINKENPILIHFPNNERFVELEGDQGTRKTSIMRALIALTTGELFPNAVNTIDDNTRADIELKGIDGELYKIKITKSTFVIENMVTDDNGNPELDSKGRPITKVLNKPKSLLTKIVGNVGINPYELQSKKPEEQIEWYQEFYRQQAPDIKNRELDIRSKYDKDYKDRTEKNREIKLIEADLAVNDYLVNRQQWEDKFNSARNRDEILREIETVKTASEQYLDLIKSISDQESIIQSMSAQKAHIISEMERMKQLMEQLDMNISNAQQTLKTRKEEEVELSDSRHKHTQLLEDLNAVDQLQIHRAQFEEVSNREKKLSNLKKESTALSANLKSYDQQVLDLAKEMDPGLPDVEICLPTESDPRKGIYYKKTSIGNLCESELYELSLLLWNRFGVSIVMVENVTSLGSDAFNRLAWFVEKGGYVFASKMNRDEKNVKITVQTNLK